MFWKPDILTTLKSVLSVTISSISIVLLNMYKICENQNSYYVYIHSKYSYEALNYISIHVHTKIVTIKTELTYKIQNRSTL